MFYVQYLPVEGQTYGVITATVLSNISVPPVTEYQIEFDNYVNTDNKVVDLETKELIDDPTQA